eukprot:TRINITY_DN8089_c0_g1_i2.p1 TRINITY_DN8089_c0_g1~~TRINITY_DN8089_c0_g1_i2.p1  ORF type:complete len:461 (-),score=135.30 TRINITY_DN8089_c0_g1_i2:124-1506(-)
MELRESGTVVTQIDKDIPRTFGDHNTRISTTEGQEALRRVLMAHAKHNPDIGYCQSLNNIAGILLCVPQMQEHQAFTVFSSLVSLFRDWYQPGMNGLRRDMLVLEKLIASSFSGLARYAEEMGLPLGLILSRYMMPLFVEWIPADALFRVYDGMCFFLWHEGRNAFGVVVGVIMVMIRATLSSLMSSDNMQSFKEKIEDCFSTMVNGDVLLKSAFAEMRYIGYDRIMELREEVEASLALADAQQARQEALHSLDMAALSSTQLDVLMERVVAVAGELSEGWVTREQFYEIIQETNPRLVVAKETLFQLFSDASKEGRLDFRQLVTACVALSGIDATAMLRALFTVFDSDHDGTLQADEVRGALTSVFSLMHNRQILPNELDTLCLPALNALNKSQDDELGFEEFEVVMHEMPTLMEFLRLQAANSQERWLAAAQNEDESSPSRFHMIWSVVKDKFDALAT